MRLQFTFDKGLTTYTSSGTFTVPSDASIVWVNTVGAGGGSGGGDSGDTWIGSDGCTSSALPITSPTLYGVGPGWRLCWNSPFRNSNMNTLDVMEGLRKLLGYGS